MATAIKKGGLGRGLGSLIPPKRVLPISNDAYRSSNSKLNTENIPAEGVQVSDPMVTRVLEVSPNSISVNPYQPRKEFHHQALEELVNSIKTHGILLPLIVTPKATGYQLIAGERRLRAAKILELEKVPVMVREVADHEKLELSLIENIQRQKLNPIEEAYAYQQLVNEFNFTQEQVAQKLGKSRSKIANAVRLLSLPEEIISAIENDIISEGHAKVLAGMEREDDQMRLFKKVVMHKLNVRDIELQARRVNGKKARPKNQVSDPYIAEKEEVLRGALGTKVTIQRVGARGKILIEFFSSEDLETLVSNLVSSTAE